MDWIKIQQKRFLTPKDEKVKGVEIKVMVSPYDVPLAVRGGYDDDISKFVIEFKYMSTEPQESRTPGKHTTIRIGKNSGRLYRIEVDVDELKAKAVTLELGLPKIVKEALDKFSTENKFNRDYGMIKDVLHDEQSSIFAQAVA